MDCASGSLCFEAMKGLPAAGVALAISLPTIAIAFWQARIAKAKLKLDLFNRRMAIFEAAWKFASEVVISGRAVEEIAPLNNMRPEAGFLFHDEIVDYLDEIVAKNSRLIGIAMRTKSNGNVVMPDDIAPYGELLQWFAEQATKGIAGKFSPYLRLSRWS